MKFLRKINPKWIWLIIAILVIISLVIFPFLLVPANSGL